MPRSIYNLFTPYEVERMLANAVPEAETFRFIPTRNPARVRNQMLEGAGTKTVYTCSVRTAVLMRSLGLEVIYEKRKEFSASKIRKMLAEGDEAWKYLVHGANIGIISGVDIPESPNLFRRSMLEGLYKHGFM